MAARLREGQGEQPGRFAPIRAQFERLSPIGVASGLVAFLCSLTPSLLPRSWVMQGLVSGVTVAGAHGLGVFTGWLGRGLGVRPLSRRMQRFFWLAIGAIAAVEVPLTLWFSASWQNEIRHAVDMPAQGSYLYVGMFLIAVILTAVLIGLARLVHGLYMRLTWRLWQFIPGVAARIVALVLVVVVVAVAEAGLFRGLLDGADNVASLTNSGYDRDVTQPSSPLRSGSSASLVSWSSIGRRGRYFIASGATVESIERLTGRPAIEPIRVYAGKNSATNLQGEANLVLAELKRTGAFDRQLLALSLPEGTGGINNILADPLEYMYGGNTAIAAMQYSDLPSAISIISSWRRPQDAGRILFDTVYRYWSGLPETRRPRIVVFGESLGAYSSGAAFSSVTDVLRRTQGAVYTGPPNFTGIWRECLANRVQGSLARLPVYQRQDGVVFGSSAADLRSADGSLRPARLVFLQHASDAIVWWAPDLAWREPDWLREPRRGDVVPEMRWFPLITFYQLTADMVVSIDPPPGHGHHYGPEVPAAWAAILRPPDWTDAETRALAAKFVK